MAGARDIAAEIISENVAVIKLGYTRDIFSNEGMVVSRVIDEKACEPTKFEQYYDFKKGFYKDTLLIAILLFAEGKGKCLAISYPCRRLKPGIQEIQRLIGLKKDSPFASHLNLAIQDAYKRLISPSRSETRPSSGQA